MSGAVTASKKPSTYVMWFGSSSTPPCPGMCSSPSKRMRYINRTSTRNVPRSNFWNQPPRQRQIVGSVMKRRRWEPGWSAAGGSSSAVAGMALP